MSVGSFKFDIKSIIVNKSVETYFQPIVSIRRRAIVGVEALSRGSTNGSERLISPTELFECAAQENKSLELDRLCRITALNSFLPIHANNPNLILFINTHSFAIEQDAHFMQMQMHDLRIDPRNIAIEILESAVHNAQTLPRSVEKFRQHGFLMAIDDMGVGHSNLDRVASVKPDILKADASLVRNIHKEYHKQEILKSLVHLSEKIGGWVIAEGIETLEEAICVLKLGGDLMQGFYFGRPYQSENGEVRCDWECIDNAAEQFKEHNLNLIRTNNRKRQERVTIVKTIGKLLSEVAPAEFESQLRQNIEAYDIIESASVLSCDGLQITESITNMSDVLPQKTIIYQPPTKGTSHTLKEYYYGLKENQLDIFETNPYVPLPSSQLCITVTSFFDDLNGDQFILCLHTKTE